MFAGFAVLLALIRIYGIVSHSVAERTQEMGLRMALGATPARVRGMLLTRSLLVIAVGAVLGVVGASAVGRSLGSLIPEAMPVGGNVHGPGNLFECGGGDYYMVRYRPYT